MVSDELQKRDRICDDKLPQLPICAVGFSNTVITVKSFFLPSYNVSGMKLQGQKTPGAANIVSLRNVCYKSFTNTYLPHPFPLFPTSTPILCCHHFCEEHKAVAQLLAQWVNAQLLDPLKQVLIQLQFGYTE